MQPGISKNVPLRNMSTKTKLLFLGKIKLIKWLLEVLSFIGPNQRNAMCC